jgi:hypothetical protein
MNWWVCEWVAHRKQVCEWVSHGFSSRLLTLRAQSNIPNSNSPSETDDSSSVSSSTDPLLRKLEDAIHRIIVRRAAPDWLPCCYILSFCVLDSVFYFKKLLTSLLIVISFWIQYSGNFFLIAGCLVSKMFMNSVSVLGFFYSWMFNIKINYNHKMFGLIIGLIELIFELLNLWHLEKMLLVIGLMWDDSMV